MTRLLCPLCGCPTQPTANGMSLCTNAMCEAEYVTAHLEEWQQTYGDGTFDNEPVPEYPPGMEVAA